MRTPRWLAGCVVGLVSTTALLAVGWWGTCAFYIGPRMFDAYVRSGGKLLATEPEVCRDADARALQVLTGLLATVIGLMNTPPSDGPGGVP